MKISWDQPHEGNMFEFLYKRRSIDRSGYCDLMPVIDDLASTLQPRTRVVFGAGTIDRVGELARTIGEQRVLLVTDPGIVAAGHVERRSP